MNFRAHPIGSRYKIPESLEMRFSNEISTSCKQLKSVNNIRKNQVGMQMKEYFETFILISYFILLAFQQLKLFTPHYSFS